MDQITINRAAIKEASKKTSKLDVVHMDMRDFLDMFGESVMTMMIPFAEKLAKEKKLYQFQTTTKRSDRGFSITDSKQGFAIRVNFKSMNAFKFRVYVAMNENGPLEKVEAGGLDLKPNHMLKDLDTPASVAKRLRAIMAYSMKKLF